MNSASSLHITPDSVDIDGVVFPVSVGAVSVDAADPAASDLLGTVVVPTQRTVTISFELDDPLVMSVFAGTDALPDRSFIVSPTTSVTVDRGGVDMNVEW